MTENPSHGRRSVADELSLVFARMSGLLLPRESVASAVELVTSLAGDTIPMSLGCGVSLLDARGRRTTAVASDPRVLQGDALQYELNQGPCLTAWATGTVVRVDDAATETRWPGWSRASWQLGMRSALSAPLVAGNDRLGAIKVYGEQANAFDARAEDLLVRFSAQAAVLLANMQALERAQQLSEDLKEALRTRDDIATAKGILMARDGLDAAEAFQMLVSVSQRQHVKLRDVAQGVVDAKVRRRRAAGQTDPHRGQA